MDIDQFYHICRAATGVVNVDYVFVFGSNAILPWIEDRGMTMLDIMDDNRLLSFELDVDVSNEGENEDLNIMVDGAIGELSPFHKTFKFWGHANSPKGLFQAPESYKKRLRIEDMGDFKVIVPHYTDLVFSKIVAGREKDMIFAQRVSDVLKIRDEELQNFLDEFSGENPDKAESAKSKLAIFKEQYRRDQGFDFSPGM